VKATPTGLLYQPFASAPRAGDADTLGGVASYWNENVFGAETSPAPLVHVAETEAELESGPEYVADVQEAIPDTEAVPAAVICTGWLYQPFESGPRWAVNEVTVGGVASRLSVTSSRQHCEPVTATVQVKVTPAVSELIVWLPQPCGLVEPAGSVNETVTSLVYQPPLHAPVVPEAVQLAVIPSARAAAGKASVIAITAASSTNLTGRPPVIRRQAARC
jgi:hypothetical protein